MDKQEKKVLGQDQIQETESEQFPIPLTPTSESERVGETLPEALDLNQPVSPDAFSEQPSPAESSDQQPVFQEQYAQEGEASQAQEVKQYVEQIALLPQEEKLKKLIELASLDLQKAISVAKGSGDAWLEDSLHDTIMNNPEWKAQLEAAGKIEKL